MEEGEGKEERERERRLPGSHPCRLKWGSSEKVEGERRKKKRRERGGSLRERVGDRGASPPPTNGLTSRKEKRGRVGCRKREREG